MIDFIKKNREKICTILIILSIFAICYFFPYTHDDWAWGSSLGLDRLHSYFKNYNGRWAGNILVIILTRSRIIRAIFESVVLTLIAHYINKIVLDKKDNKFMIALFLLLMPINVLAQGIAWTSGFANYVVPTLLSLIVIYYNKKIFTNKNYEVSNKCIIPFILCGFLGTLFVEHMTIYFVVFALSLNVYYYIKNKKISIPNICFLIAVILGTVLMFSNGAYHQIATSADSYRTIEQSNIIIRSIKTYIKELHILLVSNNVILNIIISLLLIYICNQNVSKKEKDKKKENIITIVKYFLIFFIAYTSYSKITGANYVFLSTRLKPIVDCMISSLFIISLFIVFILKVKDLTIKKRLIFELLSLIIIAGPLLIVTPIGPRCFVPTYMLFAMIALELFNIVSQDKTFINKGAAIYVILIILFSLFSVYGFTFKIDMQRINYIENHKNEEVIVLPRFVDEKYMWVSSPRSNTFKIRFKKFYKIDQKVDLKFISYKEWKKNYYKK